MTSEAQPGQEQRMVTDAMIEAGRKAAKSHTLSKINAWVSAIYLAMHAARPTADLGEDGELVEAREVLNEAHTALMAARQVILGTWADEALAKIDAVLSRSGG